MSTQAKTPMEMPGSRGPETRSVEDQLAEFRLDLDTLKTSNKSWVKTWGVYLGMLGALIAVPKGVLDLATQLWQRPNTSVEIQEISMYHIPGMAPAESVKLQLVIRNEGNLDDVLLANGVSLTVGGQLVQLSDKDFGLFEDGKAVDASLVVPRNASRGYELQITFNPRERELAATPGPHKVELRFLGDRQNAYSASVCFPLQPSDVHDMFQSSDYWHQTVIAQLAQCPGQG